MTTSRCTDGVEFTPSGPGVEQNSLSEFLAVRQVQAWNDAIDAAAHEADKVWVEANGLIASKTARMIADLIRGLRKPIRGATNSESA